MPNSEEKSELIRIAKKVLQGKASPEEEQFLKQYYNHLDKSGIEPEVLSDKEKKILEDKILHRIYLKTDLKDRKNPFSLFGNKWMKMAAAVALLIVTGTAYFYYNYPASKKNTVNYSDTRYTGNDVKPGGNKAVLTLSNGSQIILDSVHNGMLVAQGKSMVLKKNSAQLIYNPANANPVTSPTESVEYNTLTTPRGGKYRLTLPDGTKVWLNAASSLTYPTMFTGKERKVVLTGEAYFEVAKNENQPFKVTAGNTEVEVLGTHFDVMAYSDEPALKTTLLEGAVKVKAGDNEALLEPGQQAVVKHILMNGKVHGISYDNKINVISNADLEDAVAWKNDYFSFYRTDIYEIMRQVSRWYDVDVVYPEDSLAVFLNGSISRDVNASEVFKMLEMAGGLKFTIQGKKVIVRK